MANTPNYNLEKPVHGTQNWDTIINNDLDIIDETMKNNSDDIQTQILESTGYGVISGLSVMSQSTPNMSVLVKSGLVYMPNGQRINFPTDITVPITTADITRPRTDIVYINSSGAISYLASSLGTAAVAGSETYTITTNAVAAVSGSNTYTLNINFIANDTVTFGGVTFTATSATQDSTHFIVGSDITTSMNNLSTALNANSTINAIYTANAASGVLSIVEKVAGGGHTPGSMTVIGTGTITVGTAINSKTNDTVIINGITFTAVNSGASGNQFNIGVDTTTTVTNLKNVLNSNSTINALYIATSSNNIITLTEKIAGGSNTPTLATVTGTVVITNGTIITSTAQIYPSASSIPAGGFLLCQIAVGGGVTSIVQNNIIDKRNFKVSNNTLTSQMADMTVNVRFLGAKCDGITDDWKVIQNYLDNNLSNYNLSFPMNKICYVSKSLVINDQHYNVHLVGQLGSVLYTDKQIALIDFQGTWDYVGIRQVIQNCSIENLRLKYSLVKSNIFSELYAVGGMKSFHSEDFSLPDDFTGNINSIAIQANSFYINKIKDCSIEGFGYGIKLNRECCRNIISGNSIRNCRAPIYCKKNAVCNANIIEDNNITDNLGLPIFIDIGASNVIKNNDIEGNYRTINNLPGNEIMFLDINNNVINASAIYLNNCRKTFIAGNYFEGNDRWYNGLCITQPIMLDGISKITTLIEGNYYNISEMDLTNTSSQFIMGNSKINFDDGNYIGEGGATNIIGDNLVINPEFNLSYDTNTIVANKTITVGNLSYMRNHYIVYLAQPDVIPITIVNSSKFNGYKNIQFNAQGCLISRVGVLFNIPDNLLHSGSQFSLKFGIWVKSERVGTLSMYPMIISSDSIRINETICSQFNTQENKYEFITGYLSINNAKNLIKNPSFAIYFIPPRCLVNTVTKVSDTELKINCSYSVSANTSNYFKTGDTVTLSDGQSGVISQINSDDSIVLQGDYLNYIPSGITHIVVTAFAEGHCNVSIECPQAVSKGMLQPYSPNKMKNCITKEYILDDSGTLVLSRDEFNGKLAIAEAITLKYTCGSTPCNGTITCKQFINGYVNADTRTVIANANTNSAITLGALQSNDYNITYMNLNTLTSKKIIIQWWIPEEV